MVQGKKIVGQYFLCQKGKNWDIFTYSNNKTEYFKFIELFYTNQALFLILMSRG